MTSDSGQHRKELSRYAGLTGQLLAGMALAVWGGMKIDEWMQNRTPLAVWILPLLFITGIIIKIIKETGQKKNNP